MATGFQQRFKGKITAASFWLGGTPVYGSASVLACTTAGTATLAPTAIATITSSSALSIWTLGFAPSAGAEFSVDIISVATGAFIKAAAGTSFDPSTNTVIKSTYAQTITLIGLSSIKWAVKSVFPPTTAGVAPLSGITLSTTT